LGVTAAAFLATCPAALAPVKPWQNYLHPTPLPVLTQGSHWCHFLATISCYHWHQRYPLGRKAKFVPAPLAQAQYSAQLAYHITPAYVGGLCPFFLWRLQLNHRPTNPYGRGRLK